ncbi:SEFIR domain-containing protein [Cupriavidus plantarum]|uniref:SEFIR domain-containing protein n=1 Tax=Cupriavidus plantarum TaxID=942865 RepID=UPI001B26B0E0|nr:SEFIR domain-containing protein [Cupriavidus plantarum]CAG2150284.1 hypothetical protein LMG26296_04696 [Cupriavidus plantarum]SMR67979.1 SEFIR domain-containing protein [Cupriavidus plantarum]
MTTAAPKLFISYSWSNALHEQWVVQLAESLVESGVDVLLDKWDLREGHDTIAYMEQMVTDPAIQKVLIICDETYAQKADGRDGGVGTETQIISKGVYEKTTQEKFVAVIASRDAEGKPYLPTYYSSRIYIDPSDNDRYASEFEKLLRWVFNKPLYVKPTLGSRPSFIDEPASISLGTTTVYRRCLDALRQGKSFAPGAIDEYFEIFAVNLERIRLESDSTDDAVVESIEKFMPYRNEYISLVQTIAQYSPIDANGEKVHRFLERIYSYTKPAAGAVAFNTWQFQNYKYIIHELFLYTLAVFLRHERFHLANVLLEQPYYLRADEFRSASAANSYTEFYQSVEALEHRKRRLQSNRISLHADLLQEHVAPGFDLRYLMQADFVAFMRNEIVGGGRRWWPVTLVYLGRHHGPFEIFARSASSAYFDRAKVILGVSRKQDIEALLQKYETGDRRLPRFDWSEINPSALLGFDELCTSR